MLITIVCPDPRCGKEFRSIYNFKLHESFHKGVFKFTCSICGKGFMNKNHFITHNKSHMNTRGYHCSNCPWNFIMKSSLTWHVKLCFVMTKAFRCQVCGKYFKSAETLGKHMTGIHRVRNS